LPLVKEKSVGWQDARASPGATDRRNCDAVLCKGRQPPPRCVWPAIRTTLSTPPGYRGVTRVLGTVEGLKQFVTMHESPYHGLNFCQGTVAEMLDDPGREIFAVIRWFGERAKILNVHFRNIKGKKLDLMEAFPDEGDMDMPRALAACRDVGYPYMLMPDHVPQIDGRDPSGVAFAYCYGYIQALVDALVLPLGRARLCTEPWPTGSLTPTAPLMPQPGHKGSGEVAKPRFRAMAPPTSSSPSPAPLGARVRAPIGWRISDAPGVPSLSPRKRAERANSATDREAGRDG
jgi:hypothetical protein